MNQNLVMAAVGLSLLATTCLADQNHNLGGNVLGACATFAADGKSAAVTFDANSLSLDITDPLGKSSHLSIPLRYKLQITNRSLYPGSPNACDVYFDREGDLVAIGIDNLQVGIADVKTMEWIGDWDEANAGIASPSFAGFIEGTNSLVVAGEPPAEDSKGIHWGLYATAVFDPSGKQLTPLRIQRYAPDGHMFRRFADGGHNRLWVFRCELVDAPMSRQPLCPVASTSLTGNQQPSSPEFVPSMQKWNRVDLWFYPSAFAAPDLNTIVFGEGTTIWAVNTEAQTIHRLVLPKRPHFPSFEEIGDQVALSPDGQVVAVTVNRSRLAFPFLVDNYVYQGTDIAVIQIDPLRLLGVLRYGRTVYAPTVQGPKPGFAIDHRQGRVTALVYRHGRWEREEFNGVPQP